MTNNINNLIPKENKAQIEEIKEINNEIPTYEEFMKTYKRDKGVIESYESEFSSYGDIINRDKGYGPCDNSSSYSRSFGVTFQLVGDETYFVAPYDLRTPPLGGNSTGWHEFGTGFGGSMSRVQDGQGDTAPWANLSNRQERAKGMNLRNIEEAKVTLDALKKDKIIIISFGFGNNKYEGGKINEVMSKLREFISRYENGGETISRTHNSSVGI